MKTETFKQLAKDFNNISVKGLLKNIVSEEDIKGDAEKVPEKVQVVLDAKPAELVIDAIIELSQNIKGIKKSFQFIVCDVWLRPNNVYTIVSKTKIHTDENSWILFYDQNTWYVRKPLQAAATVRVKLISIPVPIKKA